MGEQLPIKATQRRTLVTRNKRRSFQSGQAIGAHLIDRHTRQGLNTGDQYFAFQGVITVGEGKGSIGGSRHRFIMTRLGRTVRIFDRSSAVRALPAWW